MRKARGEERRKWECLQGWGIKIPKGFVDRRRKVERRKSDVTEGSLEEFESLMKSLKEKNNEIAEPTVSGFDQLNGRL